MCFGLDPAGLPTIKEICLAHTAFQVAALSNNITLYTLPAAYHVLGIKVKHTAQFVGAGFTSYKISVGLVSDLQRYSILFDVLQAPANTILQTNLLNDCPDQGASTLIKIQAISTGANLNLSSAGNVCVWLQLQKWD